LTRDGAVPQRSLEAPLGIGGEALHDRLVRTRHFRQNHGGIPPASNNHQTISAMGIKGLD
jgi:hypothetical protein